MTKNINSFWQIVDVQLLDKRGYLTICLTLAAKDGKLFLRKPEGIRDWYQTLKVKLEHLCNNIELVSCVSLEPIIRTISTLVFIVPFGYFTDLFAMSWHIELSSPYYNFKGLCHSVSRPKNPISVLSCHAPLLWPYFPLFLLAIKIVVVFEVLFFASAWKKACRTYLCLHFPFRFIMKCNCTPFFFYARFYIRHDVNCKRFLSLSRKCIIFHQVLNASKQSYLQIITIGKWDFSKILLPNVVSKNEWEHRWF